MASVLSKSKLSLSKAQEPKLRGQTRARGQMRAGLLLTLPALLVMAATVVYPILWSLNISFFSAENFLAGSSQFVGLSNYARVLSSGQFQNALWNTGGFVVATIIIELIIGFAVA